MKALATFVIGLSLVSVCNALTEQGDKAYSGLYEVVNPTCLIIPASSQEDKVVGLYLLTTSHKIILDHALINGTFDDLKDRNGITHFQKTVVNAGQHEIYSLQFLPRKDVFIYKGPMTKKTGCMLRRASDQSEGARIRNAVSGKNSGYSKYLIDKLQNQGLDRTSKYQVEHSIRKLDNAVELELSTMNDVSSRAAKLLEKAGLRATAADLVKGMWRVAN